MFNTRTLGSIKALCSGVTDVQRFKERQVTEHICLQFIVTHRSFDVRLATCYDSLHKAHHREIEVVTKRQCGEVYTAHSVSLVDVQQCALIFGKVGERIALSGFEVATLRKVAAGIVSDTKITRSGGCNGNGCILSARYTPGQYTTKEVPRLVIAIANAPTGTDECRE